MSFRKVFPELRQQQILRPGREMSLDGPRLFRCPIAVSAASGGRFATCRCCVGSLVAIRHLLAAPVANICPRLRHPASETYLLSKFTDVKALVIRPIKQLCSVLTIRLNAITSCINHRKHGHC